jgi:hypothetical protein
MVINSIASDTVNVSEKGELGQVQQLIPIITATREDQGSRPIQAKSSRDPISTNS